MPEEDEEEVDFDQFDPSKILGNKAMQNLPRAEVANAKKNQGGLLGADYGINRSEASSTRASALSHMFPEQDEEEEKKAGDNGD